MLCQFFICNYFLPFWGLSFHLAYSFLWCAKLLSLIRTHMFTFVFISITLGGGSNEILKSRDYVILFLWVPFFYHRASIQLKFLLNWFSCFDRWLLMTLYLLHNSVKYFRQGWALFRLSQTKCHCFKKFSYYSAFETSIIQILTKKA